MPWMCPITLQLESFMGLRQGGGRWQVEHTCTEEVTGFDLVQARCPH